MSIFSFFKKIKNAPSQEDISVKQPMSTPPLPSQQQATEQIMDNYSFAGTTDIDELNRISRARSEALYEERQTRVGTFDPYEALKNLTDVGTLTSTERYFLKGMAAQPVANPTVYAYWTYEYSINFAETMTKLLSGGYLTIISNYTYDLLPFLLVPELKEILKENGLVQTGKKADLMQRIKNNIPLEVLEKKPLKHPAQYFLTQKGKRVTSDLPKSATKNLEFEDACMENLIAGNFQEAYRCVCRYELNKMIARDIGFSWDKELQVGLAPFTEELYEKFMESDLLQSLPTLLQPYPTQIKASIILGNMSGFSIENVLALFTRYVNILEISTPDAVRIFQLNSFRLMDAIQKHSFDELLN